MTAAPRREDPEVVRLRETVHILAAELAALKEGVRRVGVAIGIPLLPDTGEAPAESQYGEAAAVQARRRGLYVAGGTEARR